MATVTVNVKGGEKLAAKLAEIAARTTGNPHVRIGFLENSTYPDGQQVAYIAALNEFGVPKNNQPPRPFFRRMIAAKKDEWGPALGIQLVKQDYDAAKALDVIGSGIAGQLRQSIVDLVDPALSPVTIKLKSRGVVKKIIAGGVTYGPEKPLVFTGFMLSRVDHEVVT